MPADDLKVQLADHEYVLEPQPYAYLRFELKRFVSELTDLDVEATDILGLIGGNAYKLLAILIPGFMPRFEFEGYSSTDAYDADQPPVLEDGADEREREEYVDMMSEWAPKGPDARRSSPTNDQILSAIDRAAKVNRLDLVKQLKNIVDADFLSVILKRLMIEAVGNFLPNESPSSPLSTDSPTPSTTERPSEEPNASDSTGDGDLYREGDPEIPDAVVVS